MITNKENSNDDIILSVIVLTYNQQNTILQTLQSIIDQKTNFFFEILIGDDNSIDDTRNVINTFIGNNLSDNFIIKLIHNEQNLGLINNFQKLINACSGKFTSIISGDDYWIDNQKIQMQVDYLEARQDFGLVHTNFNILHVVNGKIELNNLKKDEGEIFEQLLVANQIGVLTAMFRYSLAKQALESNIYKNNFLMEDYPLWLFIANTSKIGYINTITSVYRKFPESISNSLSFSKNLIFENSVLMVQSFFLKFSNKKNGLLNTIIQLHKRHLLLAYIHKIDLVAFNSYSVLKEHKALSFTDKKNYCGIKFPILFKFLKSFKRK